MQKVLQLGLYNRTILLVGVDGLANLCQIGAIDLGIQEVAVIEGQQTSGDNHLCKAGNKNIYSLYKILL